MHNISLILLEVFELSAITLTGENFIEKIQDSKIDLQ